MADRSRKSTLLLVDDDVIVTMSQKQTLEGAGYKVHVAHNRDTAVSLLAQRPDVELVVMDIELGAGPDGILVAREMLDFRELPVVFLTNHSEREVVERVKSVSRFGYVTKDSGEFVLLETIERALDLFAAHQKLLRAEERFRYIINDFEGAAVQGYLADGTTILWNPASEKLYGYTEEEALGRKLWDLIIPKKLRKQVIRSVERMVRTGEPVPPEELVLRHKDGSPVEVYSSHSVYQGADGRNELYCIDIDLSERKKAQAKLRQINKVFNSLGTDPDENIRTIVEETCTLLGAVCSLYNKLDDENASLCTWAGKNLPPDFKSQDAPDGHICYEATMKSDDAPVVISDIRGTPYNSSDANVAKYGLRSYLGYPVRFHDRNIGALCVVDTVPRHFTDTELHIIGTLAKGVELEEARKAAQRQITDLLEEKELLLKELQHRVKNDLVLMKSMLSIQAAKAASAETESALREAEARFSVLGRIYERLVLLESGQSVELMTLVRDVIQDLRSGILPSSVAVDLEGSPVVAPTRIAVATGILVNELITNSVKYAFGEPPEGSIRVTLSGDGPGQVRISVADNGRGYPDALLKGGDYGFGLTVVSALVAQHKGHLELSNADGARANISLHFPT